MIEPLTNPVAHGGNAAEAFDVTCPSPPGYGFSGKPTRAGWRIPHFGAACAQLMARLNYDRYGVQAGDWGSAVRTAIGGVDPEHCAGIHLNMVMRGRCPEADRDRKPTTLDARTLAGVTSKVE